VAFDHKHRRIRCIAHIINLSLQAFLLARSKEALNAALEAASDVPGTDMFDQFATTLNVEVEPQSDVGTQQEQATRRPMAKNEWSTKTKQKDRGDVSFSGWQGIPALSKLHAIAVWLRSSSPRCDSWRDVVGMALGIDNATRWSSWYKVIDVAMKKKDQITIFLGEHDSELDGNILTSSDWELLRRTHKFLQPFTKATLWAEGANSSISQSLNLMDMLLLHYEIAEVRLTHLVAESANQSIRSYTPRQIRWTIAC